MNRDLVATSIGGLSRTAIATILKLIAKVAFMIAAVRMLSPDYFGVYALAIIAFTIVQTLCALGVQQTLIQRPNSTPGDWKSALVLCSVTGIVGAFLLWFLRHAVEGLFGFDGLSELTQYMAASVLLLTVAQVPMAQASREHLFGRVAIIDLLSLSVFNYLFVIFALTAGVDGFLALGIGHALENFAKFALYSPRIVKIIKKGNLAAASIVPVVKEGLWYSWARYANFFAIKVDDLIVGALLGPTALGLYSKAYELMAIPSTLYQGVADRVIFPTMSRAANSLERVKRAYLGGVGLTSTAILPVAVGVLLLADPLSLAIFGGGEWLPVSTLLMIFSIAMYFRAAYRLAATALRAIGKVKMFAITQSLYGLLVGVLALAGSHYGVNGVGVGVMVAIALNWIIQAAVVDYFIKVGFAKIVEAHFLGFILSSLWLPTIIFHEFANPFGANLLLNIALSVSLYCTMAGVMIFFLNRLVLRCIGDNDVMKKFLYRFRVLRSV